MLKKINKSYKTEQTLLLCTQFYITAQWRPCVGVVFFTFCGVALTEFTLIIE